MNDAAVKTAYFATGDLDKSSVGKYLENNHEIFTGQDPVVSGQIAEAAAKIVESSNRYANGYSMIEPVPAVLENDLRRGLKHADPIVLALVEGYMYNRAPSKLHNRG